MARTKTEIKEAIRETEDKIHGLVNSLRKGELDAQQIAFTARRVADLQKLLEEYRKII